MNEWWNKTVFYQIYMPSFCDGNGDGRGDFKGIISKLPYLKELGVGGIWLTPFYPSPKVDQGYDISDYYGVDPDYGSMEDFEAFIAESHRMGIKVISDIVINHTSDQHPWFQESRSSRKSKKRDWYIWRPGEDGRKPNNWKSFFGEDAWEWDESSSEYYYHSFAKEQTDLNWKNPEVKQAVFEMLDFWADKGVDGFRLDVINNLTLTDRFPDNPVDENGEQIHEFDVNQPGILEALRELCRHLEQKKELFLVGEISSDDLRLIHSYTEDGALHTTFNFNLGSMPEFDFQRFYQEVSKMNRLYKKRFPTLFFGSHDMDRFPSRFQFTDSQVKGLLTFMLTYRGIPFLYFGDEIGMKSVNCDSVDEARDIQGIIAYQRSLEGGDGKEKALKALNLATRDKSRNTMQWDRSIYGGFSSHEPWIPCKNAYLERNVEQQKRDENSVWNYLKRLIHLRNERAALQDGSAEIASPAPGVFLTIRRKEEFEIMAVINFSNEDACIKMPSKGEILLASEYSIEMREKDTLFLGGGTSAVIELRRG